MRKGQKESKKERDRKIWKKLKGKAMMMDDKSSANIDT
jgi:hypothetical protein